MQPLVVMCNFHSVSGQVHRLLGSQPQRQSQLSPRCTLTWQVGGEPPESEHEPLSELEAAKPSELSVSKGAHLRLKEACALWTLWGQPRSTQSRGRQSFPELFCRLVTWGSLSAFPLNGPDV